MIQPEMAPQMFRCILKENLAKQPNAEGDFIRTAVAEANFKIVKLELTM